MFAAVIPDLKGWWAPIVAVWAALAALLTLYKDYLAIKKAKLEIEKLKSELKKNSSGTQLNPAMLQKAVELFEKIMLRSDFQFSAGIKTVFLCSLICASAIGIVWQKNQIYEAEKIVQGETTRLEELRNTNTALSNTLFQLQQNRTNVSPTH